MDGQKNTPAKEGEYEPGEANASCESPNPNEQQKQLDVTEYGSMEDK